MAFTARSETYFNASSLASPYDATVSKPAGTAQGDILFAILCWYGSGVTIDAEPSGWTKLGDYTANTDRYALYYKIAAASEPSSYTWSFTASAKVRIVCSCYTAGDFNGSNPIAAVSNTAYRTSDTSVKAASMTVAQASSPLVFWASLYRTSTTNFTKPSVPTTDWVEDDDTWHTDPDFANEICSMIWTGSGATGDMTATASASTSAKHAFAVALKPPPQVKTASATLSGTGSLAATAARARTAAATMSGEGSLACTAAKLGPTYYASATISGTGYLTATARPIRTALVTMSGTGWLACTARATTSAAAALSGAGSLAAAPQRTATAAATLSGAGSLAAAAVTAGGVVTASATLSATGTLTVAARAYAITPALLAAQQSPHPVPHVEARIYDYEAGIKRLSWTRLYSGSEPDNHHGIAFDGEGRMHRIRAGADSKLYYQQIADPGPNSEYSQWTQIATDCSGPCAIAACGAKIYIFYRTSTNVLWKYYSHDYGQSWEEAPLASYADVMSMAASWWATGNTVVCFALKSNQVNAITLDTSTQIATQHTWSDANHPWLDTYGIGATFNPAGPHIEVVIAAKESDSPYNHYDLFRTKLTDIYTFLALESFLMAPAGEGTTYEYPDCHLPSAPQEYETTRVTATEKYSGISPYTRPMACHLVKGASWSDTTFTEPRPLLDIAPAFGLRMASTADYWWLEKPDGVWRATRPAPQPLDVSKYIIALATTTAPQSGIGLTLTLDNSTGFFASPGQGQLASLRFRAEIRLSLGYRTAAGPEAKPAGTFWIDSWQYSHAPNQSLFTIYALDGLGLINRWAARYQMRWNKDEADPRSVWQILYQLLARVGIRLTNSPPKPQSSAINNLYPDFTIHAATPGTLAINSLLACVPDKLAFAGQQAFTKNPLPDEQSSYSYGTTHRIISGTYTRAATVSRARALGRNTDGARILQEALDWPLLSLGVDIFSQDYDPNLQTPTRTQERADAILRKNALQSAGGQIITRPNLALSLLDVVTITDPRCGIHQQKFRVTAIDTAYDRSQGRYHQTLTLAAP